MSVKHAVILHGTDGRPDSIWFPWLKGRLEAEGYKVWTPALPNNHTPNRQVYNDFLFGSGWDWQDNLVIGHSSGAVSVLNLLMDERCPKIKTGILIGAWRGGIPGTYEPDNEQFVDLFPPEGFDFEKIKQNSERLLYMHGTDDPYCPLQEAEWLAKQTGSEIVVIPNGHHLGGSRSPEFPELWSALADKIGL